MRPARRGSRAQRHPRQANGDAALARDATVTYCHSRTHDLAAHVGEADILVAAAGRVELIHGEWIRSGAARWLPPRTHRRRCLQDRSQ
jgi:hypothetical protein